MLCRPEFISHCTDLGWSAGCAEKRQWPAVFQPEGQPPVGPSAIAIPASQPCMLPDGSTTTYPVPKELTKEELQGIVKDYADAAHNAIEAGMLCRLPTHCIESSELPTGCGWKPLSTAGRQWHKIHDSLRGCWPAYNLRPCSSASCCRPCCMQSFNLDTSSRQPALECWGLAAWSHWSRRDCAHRLWRCGDPLCQRLPAGAVPPADLQPPQRWVRRLHPQPLPPLPRGDLHAHPYQWAKYSYFSVQAFHHFVNKMK